MIADNEDHLKNQRDELKERAEKIKAEKERGELL